MRNGVALLGLALTVAPMAFAAELARLTPDTFDEFAPGGKEADAIFGDFVLRSDKITAVIAEPTPGRNANMTTRHVAGSLIDLTARGGDSDQLSVLYPHGFVSDMSAGGVWVDGNTVDPGAGVHRGGRVAIETVSIQQNGELEVRVRYELADSDPQLTITTTYHNTSGAEMAIEPVAFMRVDQSADQVAIQRASDGEDTLYWCYDQTFGQAYAMQSPEGPLQIERSGGGRSATRLTPLVDGNATLTLAPGAQRSVTRVMIPAPTLIEAKAIARELADVPQQPVTFTVRDAKGAPIAGAEIDLDVSGQDFGWGLTDEDGALAAPLPEAAKQASVSALGHGQKSVTLTGNSNVPVELPAAGYVRANITDANGAAIPCKIQFIGKNGTDDPFFGPNSGEHAVHNVIYTQNGRYTQKLEPGTYEAIVSYGTEYHAAFETITVERGQEIVLETQLERVVDTPGWVSADFHSHSSPSGDNTASQYGRVLNLLCEHIEFAPCTEHNRVSTYVPHLKALGALERMATCSGIELTGSPGGLNHQNAFPLVMRPHTQDNGAPLTAASPETQIKRLALWDNDSEKLVQQNHPDMPRMFFDRDNDRERDGGFDGMPPYMDVIEIHPPQALLWRPFTDTVRPGADPDTQPRNRMATWLQLINLDRYVPGVVNTDAHWNHHGSGWLRNYIKSSTDDPAEIDVMEMVRSAQNGHVIMTNGPYLEVTASTGGAGATESAAAGDTLNVENESVQLHVRVQCPNWFDVDRVQILRNGRFINGLNFTRATDGQMFSDDTVRFDETLDLEITEDTHIVVFTAGENSTFGRVLGPGRRNDKPVAVSNPIFLDTNNNGFQGNGDTLDLPVIP